MAYCKRLSSSLFDYMPRTRGQETSRRGIRNYFSLHNAMRLCQDLRHLFHGNLGRVPDRLLLVPGHESAQVQGEQGEANCLPTICEVGANIVPWRGCCLAATGGFLDAEGLLSGLSGVCTSIAGREKFRA